MRNRKNLIVCYFLFPIFYFLIFVIFASCGKKGEPTLKSYEKPDPPSNLRVIHRGSEIILLWDFPKSNEQMIKGFYLMKSTAPRPLLVPYLPLGDTEGSKDGKGDFVKLAFLEPDKRYYIDREFIIGTHYSYKILSENLRGITSTDSNVIEIEPRDPPPPPKKPVYSIEYDSLTLTWEAIGDGVFYNIYKSDKKGIYSLTPLNAEPNKGTTFRDSFDIKKTVYYTVRSLWGEAVRDEGFPSEEVEINPLEFVPSRPEDIRASASQEGVQLMWKEAPETWVIGYRVYREIDKKEGFIFVGETSVPAYFDREEPLTKRTYRVTALGPSKEGSAAEIKDVVFTPYSK